MIANHASPLRLFALIVLLNTLFTTSYASTTPGGVDVTVRQYDWSNLPALARQDTTLPEIMGANRRVLFLEDTESIRIDYEHSEPPRLLNYDPAHVTAYGMRTLVKFPGDSSYRQLDRLALRRNADDLMVWIELVEDSYESIPDMYNPGRVFMEKATYHIWGYWLAEPFPQGISEVVYAACEFYQPGWDADKFYDNAVERSSVLVDVPTASPDSVALHFINSEEWAKWLPAAPVTGESLPDSARITLRFKVNSDNVDHLYRFRARLQRLSCYPGRWTNDYELVTVVTGQRQPAWVESRSCRDPEEKSEADIQPGFEETEFLRSQFFYNSDSDVSWYEIESKVGLKAGDQVDIPIHSFDYAGGARLSVGLIPWKEDTGAEWADYKPLPVFPDSGHVITLPRDEEERYYLYPDTCKVFAGDSILIQLGDRLGDAWEERYYKSIYDCMPYGDDSNRYKDFYPSGTDTVVMLASDGFINFEKYRGIMGVINGHTFHHVRMKPLERSIFAANIIDLKYLPLPASYRIPQGLDYFWNLEIPDKVKIYEIGQNPQINIPLYYTYYGTYSEDSCCTASYNSECYEGRSFKPIAVYGTMRINGLIPNLPNSTVAALVYISPYRDPPRIIRQMLGSRFDYSAHPGVVRRPIDPTDVIRFPKTVHGCWYFFTPIKDIIVKAVPASSNRFDAIKELQKLVLTHEMGHFVGMKHAISDTNTVMKETFCVDSTGKILVPQTFSQDDYRLFRVAE